MQSIEIDNIIKNNSDIILRVLALSWITANGNEVSSGGNSQNKLLIEKAIQQHQSNLKTIAGINSNQFVNIKKPIDKTGLNSDQVEFIDSLPYSEQALITFHLQNKSEVVVIKNTEIIDALPFALVVKSDHSIWIDCFDNIEDAKTASLKLGLQFSDPYNQFIRSRF